MSASAYHHGDLPAALLEAVDGLVREGDVAAVTLRAAARRAGVSHAAPAHHFGDKAGLLTAYATQGFVALRDELAAAGTASAGSGVPPLFAMGLAYVRFAVEHPGHFAVMFRPELVNADLPAFQEASDAAFGVLLDGVRSLRPDLDPEDPQILLTATGAWSMVHGFATLWLEGNLPDEITGQPLEEAAAGALLAFGGLLAAELSSAVSR